MIDPLTTYILEQEKLKEGTTVYSFINRCKCGKRVQNWKVMIPGFILGGPFGAAIAGLYTKRGKLNRLCTTRCLQMYYTKKVKEEKDPKKQAHYKRRVNGSKINHDKVKAELINKMKKLQAKGNKNGVKFIKQHMDAIEKYKV